MGMLKICRKGLGDCLFEHPGSSYNHIVATGETLTDADLAGKDLSGSTFDRCDLRLADLSRTVLMRVTFKDCNLSGIILRKANLAGCTIRGCDLRGADLTDALGITEAILEGNILSDAIQWPEGYTPGGAGSEG